MAVNKMALCQQQPLMLLEMKWQIKLLGWKKNQKKTFKVEGLYTSLFSSRLPASIYMFNVNNRNTRTIYINKLHPQIYLNECLYELV